MKTNTMAFGYDQYGRSTEMTDSLGNKTVYEYSAMTSNPSKVMDALGNVVEYTYDAAGRTLTMTRYRQNEAGEAVVVWLE